jgi:anti-anti-sigma regulatory factor
MDIIDASFCGVSLLTVVGEVDHGLAEQLAAAADRSLGTGGARLLVDLERCAYRDSGSLGVLLRLLELTGLTSARSLRVFGSLDEARSALESSAGQV